MKISRKILSVFFVAVLFASLPGITFAQRPDNKIIGYVALGDSLAHGMTPDGGLDLGYPDYLLNRFEQSQYTVDYTNFGMSGFTSADLKENVSTRDVQTKIKEADFITIDIGANDLLQVIHNPAAIPSTIGTVAMNLDAVLKIIDDLNADVKVYIMGYYNPFPHHPQELQAGLLPLLDALNQTIEARALANGDTYVATEKIIAKHYETYLPNPENIHLSGEGYQLVAKEFWKNIDKRKN